MAREMSRWLEVGKMKKIELYDHRYLPIDVRFEIIHCRFIGFKFHLLERQMEIPTERFHQTFAHAVQEGLTGRFDEFELKAQPLGEPKNHRFTIAKTVIIDYVPNCGRDTILTRQVDKILDSMFAGDRQHGDIDTNRANKIFEFLGRPLFDEG